MTRRGVRAHRARTFLAAVGLTALACGCPLVGGIARAQDEGGGGSAPAATPTPQTLTESDYFRTIKVIQKRPVAKARRVEFCPFFSYLSNDDFVRGYVPGAHLLYHTTEGVAIELTAAAAFHSDKSLLNDVQKMGVQPQVLDRMNFLFSAGLNWAPIYGKIAYLERRILAYDLFLATGYGVTNTTLTVTTQTGATVNQTTQNASFQGYYIGIGQRYYLSNRGAIRIELRNYAYTQRVDSAFNDRNNLLLGIGYSFLL